MAEQWDLDEEGLRRLGALTLEQSGRAEPRGCGSGAWVRGRRETGGSLGSPRWRQENSRGAVPEAEKGETEAEGLH